MKNLENNRKIVEFMGVKPRLVSPDMYEYHDSVWFACNGSIEYVTEGIAKYVKYDSDWNWLMQVVEKIESLGYYVNITGTYTSIGAIDQKNILLFIEKDSLISKVEAVYNACISFIDWYNLNK